MRKSDPNPTALLDPLADSVENLLRTRGSARIRSLLAGFASGERGGDGLQADQKGLEVQIAELCASLSMARGVFVFRRIPCAIMRYLPQSMRALDVLFSRPVIDYAILFGTKALVAYGDGPGAGTDRQSLVQSALTQEEFDAAFSVFVFSALHGYQQYRMNTLAREAWSEDENFSALIDSYNRRSQARFEDEIVPAVSPAWRLVTPARADGLSASARVMALGATSQQYLVQNRNYVPVVRNLERIEPLFRHLDGSQFQDRYGLSFERWLRVYRAANAMLCAALWTNADVPGIADDELLATAERADDFGCSAIGSARRDMLEKTIGETAARLGLPVHAEDIRTFLAAHTTSPSSAFDGFVESDRCFYPIDGDRVIWDYVRFAALLPVMRRILAPLLREMKGSKNLKGRSFEAIAKRELKTRSPIARALSEPRKRTVDGNVAFEFDVGFVAEDVLFILDCKYEVKSRSYVLGDARKVDKRLGGVLGHLDKLDRQLREHLDWTQKQWPSLVLKKAIAIVCTAETEFIKRSDSNFWLVYPDLPRACTLPELINFLSRADWRERVDACPATLSIDCGFTQ